MRVESLGFFRFVAAIVIVIAHSSALTISEQVAFIHWPIFSKFSGYQMVAFFFVLSGYANYLAYGASGEFSMKRFTISRIARIFPLYYFSFLLVAGLRTMLGKPPSDMELFLHLSFLHSWIPDYAQSVTHVTWTLSVDIFLYLLFPVILYWMHKKSTTPRKILILSGLVYLITTLCLSFLLSTDAQQLSFTEKNLDRFIHLFPLFHISSFLIGIVAGYWVTTFPQHLKYFSSNTLLIIYFVGMYFLIVEHQQLNVLVDFPLITHVTYGPLLGIMMLIMTANRGIVTKTLSHRFFVYLGTLSYGVYVFQILIFFIYQNTIWPLLPNLPPIAHVILGVLSIVLFSMLILKLVERPANNYLRKKLPQIFN